ncbi:MAG: tRNA threonylcarbamoyladenosine dehydratase [Bdellovibrionales bacterium]|nr:tRNA threonylcarbamoyladenosine dehydratase [Bdellovibrionales bacterium]
MVDEGQFFKFGGVARIFGEKNLERIAKKHFCIIGIGGVGSWAAESLGRTGLGKLTLIDYDDICQSNINRQIHASLKTVGKMKTTEMKSRLLDINPNMEVIELQNRYSEETHSQLMNNTFDVIIDCMDSLSPKCFLINDCYQNNRALVTVGGSAGKQSPLDIKVGDLSQTSGDRLLHKVRKKLRMEYGFPRDLKKKWGISTVYSDELPTFPLENGEVTKNPDSRPQRPIDCADGMGSLSFVTGSFGFFAAYQALQMVLSVEEL